MAKKPKRKQKKVKISSPKELIHKLTKLSPNTRRIGFACLFAIVGVVALLLTQAATPTASFEAEDATVTSPAQKVTDTTASGGSSLQFGPGQTTTTPIPKAGISPGYKILTRSTADRQFELDQIKSVGGKIVRLDSTSGNQSQVDAVVADCLARGLEPLLILGGSQGPQDPTSFANFASSQATKWKGKVRLLELFNEPDMSGWSPEQYTAVVKAAYPVIKQANPNAIVIAGALWKWPQDRGGPANKGTVTWVQRMYAAGAKGSFDMLSLHLYDDPQERGSWNIWDWAFYDPTNIRGIMNQNGDQAIPIVSTETGGPTTNYPEARQASIIDNDFDALSDPKTPLGFVLVYSMMDDDVPGFGLLRADRSQKPSWQAYKLRATGL